MPRARASSPTELTSQYREALERLYLRRRFGMRPGLEVTRALLHALGDPQETFESIHITGSKGKGSVAALAAAALGDSFGPVGLYTSPHLVSYRERIRIDGSPIAPGAVVEGLGRIEAVAVELEHRGRIDRTPTFFEVTTALAFDHFSRQKVRSAVIEVGMGGRLDATNVLPSRVTVVTTVELEHVEVLGSTLEAIATEKAGIFRPGATAISGERKPAPARVIEARARELGVPLWTLDREIRVLDRVIDENHQTVTVTSPVGLRERIPIPLLGRFQATNVALALAAVDRFAETVGVRISDTVVRKRLRAVRWPGRLERVARRPDLYFDVAHTPESVHEVAVSLAEVSPFLDPSANAVLFGCLADKPWERMVDELSTLATTLVVVPIRSDRTADPQAIRRAAHGRFPRVVVAQNAEAGLVWARGATAPEGFTLVVGSDYLIGELLVAREGAPEGEPDLSDPVLRRPGQGGLPPVPYEAAP
ncbi:MAG: bifunctional folylpolyglutamate synthase/dihydrofolate synthase [Thermoplasmata archaeon]|nr:bifunctional folylpolyglutamate synthase/dihydrofolate synthase [Thermoplasmata archaeon]